MKAATTPRNVLASWAGMAVRLLLGLWLTPFIIGHLGRDSFGLWLLIGSMLGYFDLMDLGVRSALIRYTAREKALGDQGQLAETVRRAMGASSAAAAIAFVGFLILGLSLQDFLNAGSGVSAATVRALVLIAGANLAFGFLLAFFSGVLAGARRYDLTSAVGVTLAIVRAGMTIAALTAGWGIAGLAGSVLLSSALQLAVMYVIARRIFPHVRFLPLVPVGAIAGDLVRYGLSSVLLQVAVKVVYYTDSIVIAAFLSKAAVATFGIAATLVEFVRSVVGSMTNVLTPAASEMDARRDLAGLRALLERGTSLSLVLAAPPLATFLLDRGRFIDLWVGAEFAESAAVLRILTLGQLVALPTLTGSVVLYAMNRHRWNAFLAIGEAAANLLLSVLLVGSMGLTGVAWGTTIPLLVTQTLLLPAYVCRRVEMRPLSLLRRAYLPALGAGALYAACFRLLFAAADPGTYVTYFACVGAALAPYAAVTYAFVLDPEVRRAIRARVPGAGLP
jgi:O-antigen/teichoic acid export membrane protein